MRHPRTSRVTYVLSAIICIGFLYFFFLSPSSASSAQLARQRKSKAAAANALSPPTSAFRKQPQSDPNGRRIPPPVVHYQLNNLSASADPVENKERILILTPLARFYKEYWSNLLALTYPHEYISLGFIIPKGQDGNAATSALQSAISATQSGPEDQRFQSITILRQDFDVPIHSQSEAERHKMKNQKVRRAAMSRARNSLLFTTIGPDTSWILWLDSDIVETPPTLIQDLASHDKPIIVPNCYQRYTNEDGVPAIRPYDFNSWQDSDDAQDLAAKMDPDDILLEGYGEMPTYRNLMAHLADTTEGRDTRAVMWLDGVGGTALLVKAEVHRDGAMFPPFPFYHLIETEGFAKMAKRLGWQSWGLPNYFVSCIWLICQPLHSRPID
jgi:mannan polymerase complexes MNN9 subunit